MLQPAKEWLCSSCSEELHFPCSSNLLQFLGKRLPFRCVASVGGNRRVKGDGQGEPVPAMELDADPGSQ